VSIFSPQPYWKTSTGEAVSGALHQLPEVSHVEILITHEKKISIFKILLTKLTFRFAIT
jgi:hypothetical protein